MTKYFVCKIWVFDEEDFNTAKSVKDELESLLDIFTTSHVNLLWESTKVEQVALEEYEKED